jgi:uncharacterized protein (DUF433 family)
LPYGVKNQISPQLVAHSAGPLEVLDAEIAVEQLDRITQNPEVMGGKACIRGMRVTVGMIVGQIRAGRSVDDVLTDFPNLEREDILQALRYAAWRAEQREVLLGQRMKLRRPAC